VIHVPYYEWQGMETRLKKHDYITAALYQAGWKGPASGPPLLHVPESAGAHAVGGMVMDPTLHSAREGDKEDSVVGLAESVAGAAETSRDGGVGDLRERERRLALLPLHRKAGAKSSLLQRQTTARRRR